jgi:hypothetical protein
MMLLHERLDTDSDAESTLGDTLVLEWSEPAAVSTFADAVLSVFGPTARKIESVGSASSRSAAEVVQAIQWPRAERTSLRLHLANGSLIQVVCQDAATVRLIAPAARPEAEWLQASAHLRAPFGMVFVPSANPSNAMPFWRAIVGIASRCGDLLRAVLRNDGPENGPPTATWSRQATGQPLVATALGTRFEVTVTQSYPLDIRALCELLDGQADPATLGDWLTRSARGCRIRIGAFEPGNVGCALRRTPTADACLFVVPQPDAVLLSYDPGLPTEAAAWALGHGLAHVVLGHVRPGDTHGHWDTRESFESPKPLHRWDRDVRAHLPAWCPPVPERRASLAECTAQEKAWLVLHDQISRMVGDASVLHRVAEQYQSAAYQRQGAQRLVSRIEQFGGAMLCDGVGLGKTYVGTTVIVHYANVWRDAAAEAGRDLGLDPFRVTVLAPESVVGTWRREALSQLGRFNVPSANVRAVSHAKLSKIESVSEILSRRTDGLSDFEHLMLSDLVVVDEAHNFRSVGAKRTAVLRDLLRSQPRRNDRRKVLLLTATPVNNGLEDLRQQTALICSDALWFSDESEPERYRAEALRVLEARLAAAKARRSGDVSDLLILGAQTDNWPARPPFRIDGGLAQHLGDVNEYFRREERRLAQKQDALRAAISARTSVDDPSPGVAAEFLDCVVVQRSRALCQDIEQHQGEPGNLNFRPPAGEPKAIDYADAYDDTPDLLRGFLPLFAGGADDEISNRVLSLKVYMWHDVLSGRRPADDVTSVVGLQRVLVLKRLESSPIAFLITLLRLLSLYAHRLDDLRVLTIRARDAARQSLVEDSLRALFVTGEAADDTRLDHLIVGKSGDTDALERLARWAKADADARPAAEPDDPPPGQLNLGFSTEADARDAQAQLDAVWGLQESLTRDFAVLRSVAPGLARVVFKGFVVSAWPKQFVRGGDRVDWPATASWGRRLYTDAKLKALVARLLRAHAQGQKAVVFSQFSDTLAYVDSVFRAIDHFDAADWAKALTALSGNDADDAAMWKEADVRSLVESAIIVTGQSQNRDALINAFAPYYRVGPVHEPRVDASEAERRSERLLWENDWLTAMRRPVDILLATDVMAEGVNLQDASLLINYDIHWNPVKMIQRSGRIDRRLKPYIEAGGPFPDLEELANAHGLAIPDYWWWANRGARPEVANMMLPESLERALQLREAIANKTLAIDFTLGLERGTGAEAEWMADYRYRGITALNAWEADRAIEQIARTLEAMRRTFADRSIDLAWIADLNGWLREAEDAEVGCLLAFASIQTGAGDVSGPHTRLLEPTLAAGVPHWLWTHPLSTDNPKNFWLVLDGATWPAATRTDLPYHGDASRPITPEDLLSGVRRFWEQQVPVREEAHYRKRLQQGLAAISAGLNPSPERRAQLKPGVHRILQFNRRAGLQPAQTIHRATP